MLQLFCSRNFLPEDSLFPQTHMLHFPPFSHGFSFTSGCLCCSPWAKCSPLNSMIQSAAVLIFNVVEQHKTTCSLLGSRWNTAHGQELSVGHTSIVERRGWLQSALFYRERAFHSGSFLVPSMKFGWAKFGHLCFKTGYRCIMYK